MRMRGIRRHRDPRNVVFRPRPCKNVLRMCECGAATRPRSRQRSRMLKLADTPLVQRVFQARIACIRTPTPSSFITRFRL